MLIRVKMDLAFNLSNRTQAEALRDAIVPFITHATPIPGTVNSVEEVTFVMVEKCYHDEEPVGSCEVVAKWVVGVGRVI